MFFNKMRCAVCGSEHTPEERLYSCPKDDGRLDIFYDYDGAARHINRETLAQRRPWIWKYRELLPVTDKTPELTLGEGNTPLLPASNLGRKLGVRDLYIKDETGNPTASFKDRCMVVGVAKALEFGESVVASASSGNAAASLSAYAAKSGLKTYTFVPEDAPRAKIAQLILLGATVIRVEPDEEGGDPTVRLLKAASKKYGWYPCPSFGPINAYQAEGPKTIAFEAAEQFGWRCPDWVLAPVGSGGLLAGCWKGFFEFQKLGLLDKLPRMAAVQSKGCAPVVKAFLEETDPYSIPTWPNPKTVAGGLADPYPWDGDAALKALEQSSGEAVAVTDEQILEAQTLLARTEGIFAEPSGVTALAGLAALRQKGIVSRDERVLLLITGSGLKDTDIVLKRTETPPAIPCSLEALAKVIQSGEDQTHD